MSAAQGSRSPFQQLLALEERVRLCAPSLPRTTDFREHWTGVRLRLAEADYVVRINDIAEILDRKALTRVPGCAGWLLGVLNLRGRMLPVYGAAEYFRLGRPDAAAGRREAKEVLVVDTSRALCGIVVDEIHGMEKFYQDDFREAGGDELERLGPLAGYVSFVNQVGEKLCHRLDIEALAMTMIASSPSARESGEGNAPRPETLDG